MSGWLLVLKALDKLGGEARTRAIAMEVKPSYERGADMYTTSRMLQQAFVRHGVIENKEPGWRSSRTIPEGTLWAITPLGRNILDGKVRLVRPTTPKGGRGGYVFEEVRP